MSETHPPSNLVNEDLEGIDPNDELYAIKPMKQRKMFSFSWSQGFVAPFRSTPVSLLLQLFSRLHLRDTDVIYDLGCGDGRAVTIACLLSGCQGIGVELDENLRLKAAETADYFELRGRASFQLLDLFQMDLSPATVIYMFLLPDTLAKLASSMRDQLDRGAKVITIAWPIPGLENRGQKYLLEDAGLASAFDFCLHADTTLFQGRPLVEQLSSCFESDSSKHCYYVYA